MSDKEVFTENDWRRLLASLGEDPNRPGLHETPARVAKAWKHWTSGYEQDPVEILKAFEDGAEEYNELIVVRGIPVDASTAAVAASCANVTLAAGVLVDVVGHAQAGTDVVKADSLACRAAPPAMVIRVLRGSVSGVDTTAMTFTLTLANATTQAVQWNAQTAFLGNLSGTTLNTATVEVTGYLNGQVLVARQISPAGSTLADQFAPGGSGWSQYNLKFRPGQH